MTVREAAMKAARELKFEIFDGCFGNSRVAPSDVDLMVESRGRFLFLEGKGRSLSIESGQRRALLALSKLPGVTVLIIGGVDPNAPEIMQSYESGRALPSRACCLEDVRSFIGQWFANTLVSR